MKRILLILVFGLITFEGYSQVVLTREGLKNEKDNSKNFLVFEYDNMTKDELYQSVLHFIQKKYVSPKDVTSAIPSESISIRGIEGKLIGLPYENKLDQKVMGKYSAMYDVKYNLLIQFKDDKIRIEIPTYECSRILNGGKKSFLITSGKGGFLSDDVFIYSSKNGELKLEDVKKQIETFFNQIINEIKEAPIAKQNDDLEW